MTGYMYQRLDLSLELPSSIALPQAASENSGGVPFSLIMENQMEKKVDNEMETGVTWGIICGRPKAKISDRILNHQGPQNPHIMAGIVCTSALDHLFGPA